MRSFTTELGTARVSTPPSSATGWAPLNEVSQTASDTWARRMSAHESQSTSASRTGSTASQRLFGNSTVRDPQVGPQLWKTDDDLGPRVGDVRGGPRLKRRSRGEPWVPLAETRNLASRSSGVHKNLFRESLGQLSAGEFHSCHFTRGREGSARRVRTGPSAGPVDNGSVRVVVATWRTRPLASHEARSARSDRATPRACSMCRERTAHSYRTGRPVRFPLGRLPSRPRRPLP